MHLLLNNFKYSYLKNLNGLFNILRDPDAFAL